MNKNHEGQNEVLEGVLAEFAKLAAIPRKSGHEQAVSDFLKSYLSELGFTVMQDEANNIIADKKATAGFEKAPLTILQGHMDMVCVAEEGYDYDPLKDPIKLVRTEEYLSAEGTSLGADDGIGVAEAIYIMKTAKDHGPLRLIVTTDEEQSMKGAIRLSAEHLKDASFLINCDSENYDELTVGSAGSVDLDFTRELKRVEPETPFAWKIEVKGLLGGHSGERIGDGRGNAIRTLAMILTALQEKGEVELASFAGGKARNAIPNDAAAVFVTDLPKEEIDAYNSIMNSGNQPMIKIAVSGLISRYRDAEGVEPQIIKGKASSSSPAEGGSFASAEEMLKAMRDPRYGKDPVYTREVERKTGNSNFF